MTISNIIFNFYYHDYLYYHCHLVIINNIIICIHYLWRYSHRDISCFHHYAAKHFPPYCWYSPFRNRKFISFIQAYQLFGLHFTFFTYPSLIWIKEALFEVNDAFWMFTIWEIRRNICFHSWKKVILVSWFIVEIPCIPRFFQFFWGENS